MFNGQNGRWVFVFELLFLFGMAMLAALTALSQL